MAHGLPTKYTDFLEFIKMIKIIKEKNRFDNGSSISEVGCNINNKKLHEDIRLNILNKANNNKLKKDLQELLSCIDNNIWIEYFLQCSMYEKENWIDFESEILRTVKEICKDIKDKGFYNEIGISTNVSINEELFFNIAIDTLCAKKVERNDITYNKLRDTLLNDLNRLIRALEIYLTEYVEKLDCKVESPDMNVMIEIEEIRSGMGKQSSKNFGKTLCFNYTNTFEKFYKKRLSGDIDYIHGKADINNTIESNNMVLGIDEYLSKKRKNKDIEFIAFKKFYQRIHKRTGCKYKEWVDKIRDEWENETKESKKEIRKCISKGDFNNKKIHRVYIFGHSLDVTDRDILRDLILNDNVHTTIFYLNKDVMGQQIANLVKVIGQDELIKRTGGSTKTIEFKQQQEMIPINESKDA